MKHERSEPRPGATGAAQNASSDFEDCPLFNALGQVEGERRRDEALARVTLRRPLDVLAAQARMLTAALGRDRAEYTSDDASEPGTEYRGNAPWVGAAVRDLAQRPYIADAGFRRSARPSRKSNHVRLWLVTDRAAASAELDRLRRMLGAVEVAAAGRS